MSNLLIIDRSINDINLFIQGINSNTNYLIYDASSNLINYINNNIINIGFVFQYIGYQRFPFLRENIDLQTYTNSTLDKLTSGVFKFEFLDFIDKIKLINENVVIDILTCNVFSDKILSDINIIRTDYGITIRYSTDEIGRLSWIQESDNINIKYIYFNDEIMNWNNVLNVGKLIDNLDLFEKNFEFYNGNQREVFNLKDDIIIDSSSFITDKMFIQLRPDIIIDGNNKNIIIKTDFYKGLFVSNHINNINFEHSPLIRNIKVEFENKVMNYGSGIMRSGQEYYEIKNYKRY